MNQCTCILSIVASLLFYSGMNSGISPTVGLPHMNQVSPPATGIAPTNNGAQISCLVEILRHGGQVQALFRFKNVSAESLKVAKWQLLYDGALDSSIVRVHRDGTEVPYLGPLVKRGKPSPDEIITLEPNQEFVSVIFLGRWFKIDDSGNYDCIYRAFHSKEGDGNLVIIQSNPASFIVR